jgi:hypothetical protein
MTKMTEKLINSSDDEGNPVNVNKLTKKQISITKMTHFQAHNDPEDPLPVFRSHAIRPQSKYEVKIIQN